MAHDGHHHDGRGHPGHNGPAPARQWQTPHLPEGASPPERKEAEGDLDLVEKAFLEAFPRAPDPTSFLRLAGVPFSARRQDGATLSLLRVEADEKTDVGVLTPKLGGGGFRYDPMPASMTSRRATLAFVYFDGTGVVTLSLAEAKALPPATILTAR
jgi:hypothetical protein